MLRGGTPTAFDRLIALRFGTAAVRALEAGESGILIALESDILQTARELGILFCETDE